MVELWLSYGSAMVQSDEKRKKKTEEGQPEPKGTDRLWLSYGLAMVALWLSYGSERQQHKNGERATEAQRHQQAMVKLWLSYGSERRKK